MTVQTTQTVQPTTGQPQVVRLSGSMESQKVGRSLLQLAIGRLRRDRLTLFALGVVLFMAAMSIFAPVISQQILKVDYERTNVEIQFLKPGDQGHIFGTDKLGRDYFARLLYGGQISLGIAFLASLLALTLGVALGVTMGYFGGWVDDFINWIIATLSSIPDLFLLLIIFAIFRPGPLPLILVLGFLGWLGTARLVRGETLSIREREYILSARSIGVSDWRIMTTHILPNLLSIAIISLALDIGALILVESALSFLGLGIQEPTPSWGNMLSDAKENITKGWHLIFIPGFVISITVLCFFIIGDGLRDAFDPTSRK